LYKVSINFLVSWPYLVPNWLYWSSPDLVFCTFRLVVLFEDCCRKVDKHERFIKLKSVLKSKYQELKEIEQQEMEII